MINPKLFRNLDYIFILALGGIIALSLLILSSANLTLAGAHMGIVKRQGLWVALGACVMIASLTVDYNQLKKYTKPLYIVNIILLLAVMFIGTTNKGATRWIALGPFDFQPSELAKIIIIITFAKFLAERQGRLNTFTDLLPCFIFVGVPMLLIMSQPDLGTSLVFVAITLGMMLVAGANAKLLGGLVAGGFLAVVGALFAHFQFGMWLPLEGYQLMRLIVFIDPYIDELGSGYHMIQSLVAIGSGGLLGKGLYQGSQIQLHFLPEHHTDFIFSVIGEELGFIGAGLLLVLFYILLYRAVKIALKAKDLYGALLVTGVVSMFAFQVFVNVGMTIAITPITGLPLPFVSYGGSAMVSNLLAIGLILNVNLRRQKILF
ncbi:rod shape determining protein RodA [Desulfitispora alkaliphila]|uniref:rod shape-determining protein RodA n=1 Tax=Desulfitispora alkaliphila TaxID=622674 RepID=UPI003D256E1C